MRAIGFLNALDAHEARGRKVDGDVKPPHTLYFVIAAMLCLGLGLAAYFANMRVEKDFNRAKASILVNSSTKASVLSQAIESTFNVLNQVSANASVQGYMQDLLADGDQPQTPEGLNQAAFLRNYLESASEKGGFKILQSMDARTMTNSAAPSGIALLTMDGKQVASSAGMSAIDSNLVEMVKTVPANAQHATRIIRNINGDRFLGFLVPLTPSEEVRTTANQLGWVLGLKLLDRQFIFSVGQDGHPAITSYIAQRVNDKLEVFSPSKAAGEADDLLDLRSERSIIELLAIDTPFQIVQGKDKAGNEWIASSSRIDKLPEVYIITKGNLGELLKMARSERIDIMAYYALGSLALVFGLFGLWKAARARAAEHMLERNEADVSKIREKSDLLDIIGSSEHAPAFIINSRHKVIYANSAFAAKAKRHVDVVGGKTLESLLEPMDAEYYIKHTEKVLETGLPQFGVFSRGGYPANTVKSSFMPLKNSDGLVLVSDEDVTLVVQEKERRERTLKQMIDTLVAIMDSRDPYASTHSEKVSRISRRIAENMQLSDLEIETAEIAGRLMNIGKILIPDSLLTSVGVLNMKELKDIRSAITASANLLDGVEFNGPVVESIRQTQERMDGTGPRAMQASRILPTAKIIAAANAFVGMVSHRAYRPAMTVDEALESLKRDSDSIFDSEVISALAKYINSQSGRMEFMTGRSSSIMDNKEKAH